MFLVEIQLAGSRPQYQRYPTKAQALTAQAHYRSMGATALLLCSANNPVIRRQLLQA